MDIAASTPVSGRVKRAMEPYWSEVYANPYSRHSEGKSALKALQESQKKIAEILEVREGEIQFTSGGTESNTLALRGSLEAIEKKRGSLAGLSLCISAIEHPSIAEVLPYAQEKGMDVEVVTITEDGLIDLNEFKSKLSKKTVLVSVMLVNSEIGTIQQLEEIARVIKKKKKDGHFDLADSGVDTPLLHSDATQAPLWVDICPTKLGVDLFTLDAHKIYGPKGVGALYIKEGISIQAQMFGSKNGNYARPGTPPIAQCVGFAEALEDAGEKLTERTEKTQALQRYFVDLLQKHIPNVRINGSLESRIPGNVSITIPNAHHDFLQIALDERGVACATRSACLEEGGEGSYVIDVLTGSEERNALRFSFDALDTGGVEVDEENIERVVEVLNEIIEEQKYDQ